MGPNVVRHVPLAACIALVPVLTIASVILGLAVNLPWVHPVLTALPGYGIMLATLRRGGRAGAIGMMIWWALWLALAGVTLSVHWHSRAEQAVLNGGAYRDEMQAWLSTGVGRESTPAMFIPQHLAHAASFCALTLLTGGVASLLMGSVLMNYMSFFVGDLIWRCAGRPAHIAALVFGWNPWSVVRVCSFIVLGVVLAEPLLSRFKGGWPAPAGRWYWIGAAVAGLALDILLKTILAPLWPRLLAGCTG